MTRSAVLLLCAALSIGCRNTSQNPASTASAVRPDPSMDARPDGGRAQRSDQADRQEYNLGSDHRRSRHARAARNSQPGVFDFYLLAISWSPEFCATHPTSSECASRPGFVVHGLWPQNNDGSYPEHCSNAPGPANPQQYTNVIPTATLVEHEWATHGTCSGLAPDAYFGEIGQAFRQITIPPAFINTRQEFVLSPGAIIDQFAASNPSLPRGSIALSCGNNFLTAVEVCLSKTLTPEACQSVHTCGAMVVKVTPQ